MSKYVTKAPIRVPLALPPSMVATINDVLSEPDSIEGVGVKTDTRKFSYSSSFSDEYKKSTSYSRDERIMARVLSTFGSAVKMDSSMFASFFENQQPKKLTLTTVTKYYEVILDVETEKKTLGIA